MAINFDDFLNDDNSTSPFTTGTGNDNNQQKTQNQNQDNKAVYHIVEFFKGYNYKLFGGSYDKFEENELNAISYDYNAGFGDLRLSMYNVSKDDLKYAKTSIFLPFKGRVAEACVRIYPESAIKILGNKESGKKTDIKERRFDFEKAWEPNISEIAPNTENNSIHIETYNPGKKVKYIFNLYEEQVTVFYTLIQKLADGDFINASMMSKIFKIK